MLFKGISYSKQVRQCKQTLLIVLFCLFYNDVVFAQNHIILAENGRSILDISLPASPTISQQFAASEIQKYLLKISGAQLAIVENSEKPSIRLQRKEFGSNETFRLAIAQESVVIEGNSDRAILFGVYSFLEKLGCAWFAPELSIYGGEAEKIPTIQHLVFSLQSPVTVQPTFRYRKIDVDGGRTHNAANLKLMIDWMAKAGYNVLRVPVNHNGNGRVQWDKWREELLPEIKKRDLLLEVGGHGYQNFISYKMENGKLFEKHPEWFGKDSTCAPKASDRLVFNTENDSAVSYFISNILEYIRLHPEINIFGLWPPDVGKWEDCSAMKQYGTPQDRQAKLANKVASAIHQVRPDITLQIIAYSYTLSAPLAVELNRSIAVDFCPINQSFERQIYDASSQKNSEYITALRQWKNHFEGAIGIYSYYRKYAWRSAPVVIPRYISNDLKWYADNGITAISTYAEPGDWFTYELNHYMLGKLAVDPRANVDSFTNQFLSFRYGKHHPLARAAYEMFETVTPVFASIPFTSLKSQDSIAGMYKLVQLQRLMLQQAVTSESEGYIKSNLARLMLMLQYLEMDLHIQSQIAGKTDKQIITEQIQHLIGYLQQHLNKGVFILTGDNDLLRFTKKYGLTNQSLLD